MLLDDLQQEFHLHVVKSRPVKDVFRIETKDGRSLCLKSFDVTDADVRFIVEVTNHLRQSGFMRTPKILVTHTGESYISHEGKRFILTDWVSGRAPDFSNSDQLNAAVQTLAQFHRHAENLSVQDVPPTRLNVLKLRDRASSYKRELEQHNVNGSMNLLISLCDTARAALENPKAIQAVVHEQTSRAFVHGDYNYPNLVLDRSGVIRVIDLDATSLHTRMIDLAHILHRNAPWMGSKTMKLIERYDHVRPLTDGDRHLLFALLLVPYPIVRFIRSHPKRWRQVTHITPNQLKINRYMKVLQLLTD